MLKQNNAEGKMKCKIEEGNIIIYIPCGILEGAIKEDYMENKRMEVFGKVIL